MIRNYHNPEGTIKLIDSIAVNSPVKVYTSSTTGGSIGGSVTGQASAITTMVLCNVGTPDVTDESVNTVTVNIYLVQSGKTADTATGSNLIVSNLTIPAGETVFFSDEKIILDSGDEVWVGTSTAALVSATVSTLPV